jgi:O-antigen/teichoic acid export membrane protein
VLRFAPAHPERSGAIVRTASAAVVGVTLALAVVAAFRVPLGQLLAGDAWRDLSVYGFRAVPLAAIAVATAALHAEGRLARKAGVEAFERVAVLVCGLVGAWRGGFEMLLWGMLAGSLVAWGFAFASLRRRADDRRASFPFRDLARVGAPQLLLSLLETLRPLVLVRIAQGALHGDALGHLTTAKSFALPLVLAPELLAQALFPGMHGAEGERDHVEGERRRFVAEVVVVGALVCTIYGILAAWLLPAIGTGKYAGAVLPLVAFLPGVLAQGATAHTGYVLLVRDRLGAAAAISAVSLVVTAALAFPLLGAYGALGGAFALSAGMIVRSALLLAAARRA